MAKHKPIIIAGKIKLDADGTEFPITKKGFADAFKKGKVKFKGDGINGKDKIDIPKTKEDKLNAQINSKASK